MRDRSCDHGDEGQVLRSYIAPTLLKWVARDFVFADEELDFIIRVKDGKNDPLNLIIEVTGEQKKDKASKVSTARTLWVPAVNNRGDFGRRAFLEISDPWDAKNTIRGTLEELGLKEKSQ